MYNLYGYAIKFVVWRFGMTQIAFTGDIAFTKYFSNSSADANLMDGKIADFLSSSDYTVVNMEGVVSDGPANADKPLTHANPMECVEWIKKINGNIWNIANNHIMDCGMSGLESTLSVIRSNGFLSVGAGENIDAAKKPVIIDKDGGIGIVAVTYFRQNKADGQTPGCFVANDEEEIKRQIQKIKSKNRWCVVVSHVGQEFSQMPMPYLRKRYKKYLKYGADIVVGHHPHVVQNYETFGNKTVFYSLGNFIFDTDFQRAQSYTDNGILIKINFNENEYSWDFLAIKNDRESLKLFQSDTPAIFRNIKGFEYGILWPLAARHWYRNERKKAIFHHSEYANRSWLDWFLKSDIKKCNKPQGRDSMIGRFISLFRVWKFADKKTIDYILKS